MHLQDTTKNVKAQRLIKVIRRDVVNGSRIIQMLIVHRNASMRNRSLNLRLVVTKVENVILSREKLGEMDAKTCRSELNF